MSKIELTRKQNLSLRLFFANIIIFFMVIGTTFYLIFISFTVPIIPLFVTFTVFLCIGLGLTTIYLIILMFDFYTIKRRELIKEIKRESERNE